MQCNVVKKPPQNTRKHCRALKHELNPEFATLQGYGSLIIHEEGCTRRGSEAYSGEKRGEFLKKTLSAVLKSQATLPQAFTSRIPIIVVFLMRTEPFKKP